MKTIDKYLTMLVRGVIGVALIVLFVVAFSVIIGRIFFDASMGWSQDVIRLCFTYIIYLGAAYCVREKGHLNVDFVLGMMKPQVRKAALPAGTDLYAVSLIREDAEAVRVSAAPIRFNKQRFRGGRDGELDYAQCGEDVLYFTEDGYRLAGVLCAAYASVWELLEDGERAALNELRRHIR